MKKIFTSLLFGASLLASNQMIGQELCGQHKLYQQYYEEHPELKDEDDQAYQELLSDAKKLGKARRSGEKAAGDYIIPVVFHVFHEPGDDRADISADQIHEAIELTNKNFAGDNPAISQVVTEFKDRIGTVDDIQFRIATIDPNGNCTNGINRIEKSLANGGSESEYKSGRQWPTNKYCNIYIVPKISSGAAGYSRYPTQTNASIDGVVLLYNYLGSTGESNFNRSFTLAHELGHWLALPHVWGNSNNNDVASNCDIDDGIDDTPRTQGSSTCNTSRQTCGSLDNVQNFMDYSYCSYMFTQEQGDVMIAALEGSAAGRNNLWTEANRAATGVNYDPAVGPEFICDAEFKAVGRKTICPGESVDFEDQSYFNVNGWTWAFEGGEPASSTDQNPTVTYNTPGVYNVTLTATDGNTDRVTTKSGYIEVLDGGNLVTPFTEEFTEVEVIEEEGNYVIFNEDGGITWDLTGNAGYEDATSIYVRARSISTDGIDELISKPFNLALNNPELSFVYAQARRQISNSDKLYISISTDCGNTYTILSTIQRSTLSTSDVDATGNFVPSGQDEWKSKTIDLSNYANQTVRFKFTYDYGGGNNIYLDKINVAESGTGISESLLSNSITLLPNPNSGNFVIETDQAKHISSMSVINPLGQSILTLDKNQIQTTTNISLPSATAPGVYFVQILSNDGQRIVRKVSITK